MENHIALTNDEIHAIRVEHSEKTKNLPFDEYRKQLDTEIAPVLRQLEELKKKNSKIMTEATEN